MDINILQDAATKAATRAYVPYSGFAVGVALLCGDDDKDEIISGCNVENSSYGLSNCAERTALFTAVALGKRSFKAIAIYSPNAADYLLPCGACRQVLSEFVGEDFPFYLGNKQGQFTKVAFSQLFPKPFKINE
ncbi:MAG: cytidine deaminase [Spirochaetaceae bacterium]|nr:cytidine deaminase [Spirochaetaceae bacterium]